ncbi:MAG: Hsp20/alpha crystallin family protein [Pirellulaceae bacterium]|nr:Hsp20/alpha crystallin family protein [Pirellulaceae bacterium]
MMLGYRNLGNPFQQLRNEMDRLLTGYFVPAADGLLSHVLREQPAVNVWQRDDALYVEMEVPGVKSEEVDVAVAGGELTIKIDRSEPNEEGVTYHRRERPVGSFRRSLRLPFEVDAEKVEAEIRNGVLTVMLPKSETAKPRKISVASA